MQGLLMPVDSHAMCAVRIPSSWQVAVPTHVDGLLVHIFCHAAQVANDVACLTEVELQTQTDCYYRVWKDKTMCTGTLLKPIRCHGIAFRP
jgi:hypothetical protein